jgi:hypothetical protein
MIPVIEACRPLARGLLYCVGMRMAMGSTRGLIRLVLIAGCAAPLVACGGDSNSTGPVSEGGAGADTATGGSTNGGGTSSGGALPGTGGIGLFPGTGGAPASSVCQDYCDRAVAAGCDTPATESECLTGCSFLQSIAQCSAEFDAVLSCSADAPASCDAAGEVTFEGCEAQELMALACLQTLEPSPALQGPCSDYCDAVEAANCPAEDPDTCYSECGLVGSLLPQCEATWAAYFTCASNDTLTCDENGEVQSNGCLAEGLAAAGCFLAAGSGI